VVSITPRPRFTPGERTPGAHWEGGWVGPRAGLDKGTGRKILCLCQGSNPGRPVRSQSLYWLSYLGSHRVHKSLNQMILVHTLGNKTKSGHARNHIHIYVMKLHDTNVFKLSVVKTIILIYTGPFRITILRTLTRQIWCDKWILSCCVKSIKIICRHFYLWFIKVGFPYILQGISTCIACYKNWNSKFVLVSIRDSWPNIAEAWGGQHILLGKKNSWNTHDILLNRDWLTSLKHDSNWPIN
jgi:hypothetical protein